MQFPLKMLKNEVFLSHKEKIQKSPFKTEELAFFFLKKVSGLMDTQKCKF